jgi:hypothetical protein
MPVWGQWGVGLNCVGVYTFFVVELSENATTEGATPRKEGCKTIL